MEETRGKGISYIKVGGGIVLGFLALAVLLSKCSDNSKVTVTLNEPKTKDEPAQIEEKEKEMTWLTFDEEALMYKLDLVKMLTDKYGVKEKTLENDDLKALINKIYEYLGEDLYTKDKESTRIYNLDGLVVSINVDFNRWFNIRFDYPDYYVKYELYITDKGKTELISRSIETEPAPLEFKKYSIHYSDLNKEYSRSIIFRDKADALLSIGIHEKSIEVLDNYAIIFDTESGTGKIKISKEEYDVLFTIFSEYSERDDLESFFVENSDILNNYLDMLKEENEEFYNEVCSLINTKIESAKMLQLN